MLRVYEGGAVICSLRLMQNVKESRKGHTNEAVRENRVAKQYSTEKKSVEQSSVEQSSVEQSSVEQSSVE